MFSLHVCKKNVNLVDDCFFLVVISETTLFILSFGGFRKQPFFFILMETTDSFAEKYKNFSCLKEIPIDQIMFEYNRSGITKILNYTFGISIPKPKKMRILVEKFHGDTHLLIAENLKNNVCFLFSAIGNKDPILFALLTAIQEMHTMCLTQRCISTFKACLCSNIEKLLAVDEEVSPYYFLAFSRAHYEILEFPPPLRTNPQDAIRDAIGETNIWYECLEDWGIAKILDLEGKFKN